MARTFNELKFPQELRGGADANRRSALQMTPYLVPFSGQTKVYPPKRRLEIAVEVRNDPEMPHPVKIIHSV